MGVDVLDGKPGSGRLRRRRVILLVVIGVAVIASVGGLLISTTIKSPAQQAAETQAPGLTRLTAQVQDTVIRNTVQADGLITKPPQISSLSSGGGGGGAGNAQQVVTKIFHPQGSFVAPGNVILEVAGRPFFVFQGTVPAYRDMAPANRVRTSPSFRRAWRDSGSRSAATPAASTARAPALRSPRSTKAWAIRRHPLRRARRATVELRCRCRRSCSFPGSRPRCSSSGATLAAS